MERVEIIARVIARDLDKDPELWSRYAFTAKRIEKALEEEHDYLVNDALIAPLR